MTQISKWMVMAMLVCGLGIGFVHAVDSQPDESIGTVSKILDKSLKVVEYDDEVGEDLTVEYAVTSKTKFINVKTLKEIPLGREVGIEYFRKGDTREAVSIELYDEMLGDETDYDEGGNSGR